MKKIIPILVVSGALVGVSAISTACNGHPVTENKDEETHMPEQDQEQLVKDPLYSSVKQLVVVDVTNFTKEQLIDYRNQLLDAYVENILRIQLNSNQNYNSLVRDLLNTRISEIKPLLSQIG